MDYYGAIIVSFKAFQPLIFLFFLCAPPSHHLTISSGPASDLVTLIMAAVTLCIYLLHYANTSRPC